jgi:glycerate kinase
VDCDERPVADGGEGTLAALRGSLVLEKHKVGVRDAFGRPREAEWLEFADGTAIVEAAQAIPLDPARLDVRAASSRGLGELIREVCASS